MKRAQSSVGIGTLILFIAMILVAAIGAGVLILTSGGLQSKALSVGAKARGGVATSIEVVEIYGIDGGGDGDIDYLNLHITLGSGSEGFKLNDTFITFDKVNESQVLQYKTETTCDDAGGADAGTTRFNVEFLKNGSTHKKHYFQNGDHAVLCFEAKSDLKTEEMIRFTIVPKKGTPRVVETHVPNIITSHYESIFP